MTSTKNDIADRVLLPVVECCARFSKSPSTRRMPASWLGGSESWATRRLRLLSLIAAQREACAACDWVEPLGVSQPTISHHLKVLFEVGLVDREKRGRWVFYRPVPVRLAVLSRTLIG